MDRLSRECEHGALRRSCPRCDDANEIAELRASLSAAQAEVERLRGDANRMQAALKAAIKIARGAALDAGYDHQQQMEVMAIIDQAHAALAGSGSKEEGRGDK